MRIAIIGSRGIPAKWGGYEAFTEELAPRLAARGHDVTVYCRSGYSDPSRPSEYRGVKLIYVPYLPGKLLETASHEFLSALHALLQRFDVCYVLGCRMSWVYLIHRITGKRLVIQTDGLDWERRKWGFGMRRYLKFSYWAAMRLATRVASDSKVICDYFLKEYGVASEYLTCGAKVVTQAPVETLGEYGLIPGNYFLVVCRIEPENNIDLIVRAFEGLATDKRLVIVGGVNYASRYVRELKSTKDSRIVFTGPVYTPGHVDALCRYSYAYLDGHEVGGTSPGLLRAMGCGSCVLVLNRSFNAEVVGQTGILWEKSVEHLREKMQYVLEHPSAAKEYGRRAADRVYMNYQWDAATDAHEQCFERLVGTAAKVAGHARDAIR